MRINITDLNDSTQINGWNASTSFTNGPTSEGFVIRLIHVPRASMLFVGNGNAWVRFRRDWVNWNDWVALK